MRMAYVWEWLTDAMLWEPYNLALSSDIEAAFQAHRPSLDICVASPSARSHSIAFRPQSPCQVNSRTHRSRPVRRDVNPHSGVAVWYWWEDESHQWHRYDVAATSQIEVAWGQCHGLSNLYFQASAPGGVVLRIHRRKYIVQFEADGFQTNLTTKFSRNVRRRLLPTEVSAPSVLVVDSPSARDASTRMEVVDVPAPSVAAGLPTLSYNVADLLPYVENSDDNDCPICVMSLQQKNAVVLAKCRHSFCKDCITRWFETRPTCPVCTMAYALSTGTQPRGTMTVRIIPAGSSDFGHGIHGYPGIDIIQIQYNFPDGTQGPEHPNPGQPYSGCSRVAYLPRTKEGEDVLSLLKIAWDRRLLFSVGTSITTGRRNVVTWAGIHHKTRTWGGPTNFGYPDDTYFARVKAELAEKGVK